MAHNDHKRLAYDVRTMINRWHAIPPENVMLDATNLIQFSMSGGQAENLEEPPIDTPMDSIEVGSSFFTFQI